MTTRGRSLLLLSALAALPACAVIDGLGGGEDEGGIPGGPPDAQAISPFPDANLGPRDGGFPFGDGGNGLSASYELRFLPALTDACSPGFMVAMIPFTTAPDGKFDVGVGAIRITGVADTATFMGMVTCSSNGMPFADLNGSPTPTGYDGLYQVAPQDVNGQIDVVRL